MTGTSRTQILAAARSALEGCPDPANKNMLTAMLDYTEAIPYADFAAGPLHVNCELWAKATNPSAQRAAVGVFLHDALCFYKRTLAA